MRLGGSGLAGILSGWGVFAGGVFGSGSGFGIWVGGALGRQQKCDFIVWARPGGRQLRVQVKGDRAVVSWGYDVQPVYSTRGEGKKTYTAADIDVLAAHVIAEEKEVLVLAACRGVCRDEEFEVFSGFEEPESAVGGVSGGFGVGGVRVSG